MDNSLKIMLTEKINLNPTKSHLLLPLKKMCNTHTNHLPFYSILSFKFLHWFSTDRHIFFTFKKTITTAHHHLHLKIQSTNLFYSLFIFTGHCTKRLGSRLLGFRASLLNLFIYYFFALKVELNCTVQFLSLPTILYGQVHV